MTENQTLLGYLDAQRLTETAMHAGHLDAARELIDGPTWLVVD